MHLNFVKTLTNEKTHQSSTSFHEISQLKMRQDTIQITWDQETKRQRERKRARDGEKETNEKIQFPAQVPAHSIPLFVTQPNIIRHSSNQLHVHTAFSLWSRVHGPWAIACLANFSVCGVCGCLWVSVGVCVGPWVGHCVCLWLFGCGCLWWSVGVCVCLWVWLCVSFCHVF